MTTLTWDETFAVGSELLDQQHKILFQLINRFSAAVEREANTAELSKIFSEVLDYTETHFSMEEQLMKRFEYPDRENHMAIHSRLVSDAKSTYEDIKAGKKGAPKSAIDFLANWLEKHIKGTDTKYSSYLSDAAA